MIGNNFADESTENRSALVSTDSIKNALSTLKDYSKVPITEVHGVCWRQDASQVKVEWNRNSSLAVYINVMASENFASPRCARNELLKKAFSKFMPVGTKPYHRVSQGYNELEYNFDYKGFISVEELLVIADELGLKYSVIYAQESICARPAFDLLGIPLNAGEMGKEWINGIYHPYTRTTGAPL